MLKVRHYWHMLLTQLLWRSRLGSLGRRSVIFKPMMVVGARGLHIGSQTVIRDFARLEIIRRPELGWDASLRIGNRVNIEQGSHIVCQCDVTIDDDVSITPYCAIVDTHHPYDPPDVTPKIGNRLPTERSFVHIGAGTFIGLRATIMPNVRIGRCCVIGAGSVVTKDIPDFSIAVGSPARVTATFDPSTRAWVRSAESNSCSTS